MSVVGSLSAIKTRLQYAIANQRKRLTDILERKKGGVLDTKSHLGEDNEELMFLKPMITSFIILVFLGAIVGGGMCVCCCRKAFCKKKMSFEDTQVSEPRRIEASGSADFLSVNWDSGKKSDNIRNKFQKVDLTSSRVVSQ